MSVVLISYRLWLWLILASVLVVNRIHAAERPNECEPPTNFPSSIKLIQKDFQNWVQQIKVPGLWMAIPRRQTDIVTLANWAHRYGYTLRASGFMHAWSPLTVTAVNNCRDKILLVNTTAHLNHMELVSTDKNGATTATAAVKVEPGASMDDLLTFLEGYGFGLFNVPAQGDLTVGGVLAVGGHGTSVPVARAVASKEGSTGNHKSGHTYGSVSNLVVSFNAVVWCPTDKAYIIRRFNRSEPEAKAFLVSLGRTFLTEVTLRVGANYNLRCQSRLDIPVDELFAKTPEPNLNNTTRTFSRFLDAAGRAEAFWLPFTNKPWVKIWSVAALKPNSSRLVTSAYNYPFTDVIPNTEAFAQLHSTLQSLITGQWSLAPQLGQILYHGLVNGLQATEAGDIWGKSKNLILYMNTQTIRVAENGYVVLTKRSNVQEVLHLFYKFHTENLDKYVKQGKYPINGPVEVRITGVDNPDDVSVVGAESPALSAVNLPQESDFDTGIWLNILTFPGTPFSNEYYVDVETFFMTKFNDGVKYQFRPEWSKYWAFTQKSAWSNVTFLKTSIPNMFPGCEKDNDNNTTGWKWATSVLNAFDPHFIFTNDFLQQLFDTN